MTCIENGNPSGVQKGVYEIIINKIDLFENFNGFVKRYSLKGVINNFDEFDFEIQRRLVKKKQHFSFSSILFHVNVIRTNLVKHCHHVMHFTYERVVKCTLPYVFANGK